MKRPILWLIAGLMLAGCTQAASSPQAQVIVPVNATSTATVQRILPTRPPTATAYTFVLKPSSTPLPTETPAGSFLTYGYGPDNFPPGVDPLTGLPSENYNLLNRRPMAIKVTNFPRSVRPQWGLSLADNVYEYYLENEITRFIGVFYGKDAERVGPVRSGRFFDENVVRMYKAIFVFAYADDRVVDPWTESDLRNFLVIERPDNCPPLCRIGPADNYNTLFVNTQQLTDYINERGTNNDRQNLNGFRFEKTTPVSENQGNRLSVYYSFVSYNRWDYNPVSGRYVRLQEAEDSKNGEEFYQALSDSLTGEPIAADNVVVLVIPHKYFIYTQTTEMVQMEFMGEGPAYAFRDGKMYTVHWQRNAPESLLNLVDDQGQPYPLKPGNIWFEVVGSSSEFSQTSNDSWRVEFNIP
jgi:hypothetical protein